MPNQTELLKEMADSRNLLTSMYVMVLPLRELKAIYKDEKKLDEIKQKEGFLDLNETERNILGSTWAKWRNTTDSKVLDEILTEDQNPAMELHTFVHYTSAAISSVKFIMEFLSKRSIRANLLTQFASVISAENAKEFPLNAFDQVKKQVIIANNYLSIFLAFLKAYNENRIELNKDIPGDPKALVVKLNDFCKNQMAAYLNLIEVLQPWKNIGSLTDDNERVRMKELLAAYYKDVPENQQEVTNKKMLS